MPKKSDNSNTKASKSDSKKTSNNQQTIKDPNFLVDILMLSVLRYYTEKKNSLKASEISKIISEITNNSEGDTVKDKTVKAENENDDADKAYADTVNDHLSYFIKLEELAYPDSGGKILPTNQDINKYFNGLSPEDVLNRANALISLIGGFIRFEYAEEKKDTESDNPSAPKRSSTLKKKSSPNKARYYYFEPLINIPEFELIKGALTSNRYILADEGEYLIDVLRLLHPKSFKYPKLATSEANDNFAAKLAKLQKLPNSNKKGPKAIPSITLTNINTIHDAIKWGLQLTLKYGVYSDKAGILKFEAYNDTEWIINPYAMIWSNGQQYLIATKDSDDTEKIYHFRIDRIYELSLNMVKKLVTRQNVESVSYPAERADCPKKLQPFFDSKGRFLENDYRNTFPQMSFSDNHTSVDVILNCSKRCLSVLADNFGQIGGRNINGNFINGQTVQVKNQKLKLPYPDGEGYCVKITNVDYNAIKRLCLQMQTDIYVIDPPELRDDIIKDLKAKLDIYENL
jgi:predicted DNA-binding transcriptional regulator YafY